MSGMMNKLDGTAASMKSVARAVITPYHFSAD
jgi:hypothetical protein